MSRVVQRAVMLYGLPPSLMRASHESAAHQGTPIWQSMDESAYAWKTLKALAEDVCDKKEIQLELNLAEIMETLADGLIKQQFTAAQLVETYGAPMTTAVSKKR